MANIEIYTTQVCPYCVRAKSLLKNKGQEWKEIDVSTDADLRDAMIKKAGGKRTVPQIFIDDKHIGGFDDLNALNLKGELDKLLGKSAGASR